VPADALIVRLQRGGIRPSAEAVPQGGVVSPFLASLYFRRFVLVGNKLGWQRQLKAHIVNYAANFIICCTPGRGAAVQVIRQMMMRLRLAVKDRKTQLVVLP
jgi:hypothetical protein